VPPSLAAIIAAASLGLALLGAADGVRAQAAGAAADNGLHGRLELQDFADLYPPGSLDADLGAGQAEFADANLRLSWAAGAGPWRLTLDYLLDAQGGAEVAIARQAVALPPAPPATMFDLTSVIADRGRADATGTIDRLAIAYATADTVVRVGRQALTWGSGLVFRPMDLFDPFSPSAVDTEYKPGVDMIYAEHLFADGSDVEVAIAPRPARWGGPPVADDSSFALQSRTSLWGHRVTWLLARDHGDWTGGAGLNGALGGATWNIELVPTGLAQGGTRLSAIANISDAVSLLGRNATLFAEYFRNGFGVGAGASLSTLPFALSDRLARGQVFENRRDFLAGGASVEISPLLTLAPTLIVTLDDGSVLALVSATWSLGDNLTLIAGAQAPIGAPGTQFGGLPLAPASPTRLAPPARLYVQLRRYF
jgi:hypothetical protein